MKSRLKSRHSTQALTGCFAPCRMMFATGCVGRQQRPDAGLQHSRGQGANPGSTQGPKPSGSRLYAGKYPAISVLWGGFRDFKSRGHGRAAAICPASW
ncbi:hypothetical protein HMPREF0004_0517 [Achromobacter piechaudii ATCC 43553]|uniref:Uncharacterized protein n=1 Tax=Achromobacter piechaudii ATCC 43553 TaxID=742159 RepID=D4X4X0_9BURK|nr:hypothetical protein HMPREF0004_0517 [Achromobacter piechaudii ATCC 43553]